MEQHDPAVEPDIIHETCYCHDGDMPEDISPMTLRCTHIVHTHCFLQQLLNDRALPFDVLCPSCTRPPIDYIAPEEDAEVRTARLWNTNEVFRDDVHEFLVKLKAYQKLLKPYRSARKACVDTFKETVKLPVEFIKDQKRMCKRAISAIPGHAQFTKAARAYSRKKNQIRDIYRIWNLRYLNTVPGAPKIPTNLRSHYFRNFYVRV
jgi:hypothetical protein